MHVIDQWPARGLKVVAKAQAPADRWVHVAVSYDGSGQAAGVKVYYDGVEQDTAVENDKLGDGEITTPTAFRIGSRSHSEAFTGGVADLRLYRRKLSAAEVASLAQLSRLQATLAQPAEQRGEKEIAELYDYYLNHRDDAFPTLKTALEKLERERSDIQARGTIAHVMQERQEPATAYVLHRGEYDQRKEQVSASTPAVLPPFPADQPRNRLGFARWLLLPEHPLTARVTVNRFWQEVFGEGVVRTSGDFGVSGELPSHPELLDWLAVEFRESGWDVKALFKLIVMSATYRQGPPQDPAIYEKDPENRLLARGPRFRMDAEMVRDYALAVSGLLSPRIGGPSVKPYQPAGVWEAIAMNVSNTRTYQADQGASLYRRSLYTFIKRMAPPASMETFNAPNRELCTVRRERTNTPLQALVTLNDEQFVEAARRLAELALAAAVADQDRMQFIARRLVSRPWRLRNWSSSKHHCMTC